MPALRVAFLPDGKRFLTMAGNESYLRNVDTAETLHTFDGHAECVMAIAVSSKGCYAVSEGLDQKMRLWHLPESAAAQKVGQK